jgi:hypothetical protein
MPSSKAISTYLSVKNRAYVALYALQLGHSTLQVILATYDLTEAELEMHRPGWEDLQANHADRNRPFARP